MAKIYLGKSSVKTGGAPPNQKTKSYKCYWIHRKQITKLLKILVSSASLNILIIICMETRSFQSGGRCLTTNLGQSVSLCISPILLHSTSLEESELRQNRKNVACHTNLAVSNLVPPSTRNVYSSSTASSKEHKLKKPARGSSSSNCKQKITTSGVDHIRERLLKKGVPEVAVQLITSTRRKSSASNYNSSWRMWGSWWDKQQIHLFRCVVIKFLVFGNSYECRTIGCHRSPFSAFHGYADGKPVGQHPEVCILTSGIFNNRPLQLRYMFVWSVESVINYKKTKWKNIKNLSGKYLTYKPVILMALTSAFRASAMHCLNVMFVDKSEVPTSSLFISCIKFGKRVGYHENYIFISTQKIKNYVWCLP